MPQQQSVAAAGGECKAPAIGPKQEYLPNVTVITHENRRALFYDDLLRGKTVLINFMSVRQDAELQVTRNLARVQVLLGERLGRDVFMYSITTDPEHDAPRVLKQFAEQHGARAGWFFLTGDPASIGMLHARLFASSSGHHGSELAEDCSLGLVRYGNEAVGLWGSVPVRTDPAQIVERVEWIRNRQRAAGPPKRRGPAPLAGIPGSGKSQRS